LKKGFVENLLLMLQGESKLMEVMRRGSKMGAAVTGRAPQQDVETAGLQWQKRRRCSLLHVSVNVIKVAVGAISGSSNTTPIHAYLLSHTDR
jgi:hypothetical protein